MNDASPTVVTPTESDPLLRFRSLFGKPVAVQFAMQVPYLQVVPMTDKTGVPVRIPLSDDVVVGAPQINAEPTAGSVGVLRASECGTWLVLEQRVTIDRSGAYGGGVGRMDIYLHPAAVTYVTFVKSIEDDRAPQLRNEQ